MKILLDENFPLQLYHRLRREGYEAEHIIASGQRGIPDRLIRERLIAESDLVFVTQDTEFEDIPRQCRAAIIISRVPQSLGIGHRVDIWARSLAEFIAHPPAGQLFDLLASGEIVPWQIHWLPASGPEDS